MAGAPLDLIRNVPLFEGLGRKELDKLARSFKESTFGTGDVVAREGEAGVGFFVIADGEARVTVRGEERARLRAGDYFGEIALIDRGTRTATVTAATPLRCYGITSWEFRPLVEGNVDIAWRLLETLARRLRAEARS